MMMMMMMMMMIDDNDNYDYDDGGNDDCDYDDYRGGSRKNSDILMTTPIVPRPKIYGYIYTYKHTNTKET